MYNPINVDKPSFSSDTVTVKISDLVFKYQGIVYDLNQLEYDSLKTDIAKNGVQVPIEINHKYEILDGNHRAKICIELGLQVIPVRIHPPFGSELEERIFVRKVNLQRRQLNDFQKAEQYNELCKDELELAKQRQLQTIPTKGEKGFQPLSVPMSVSVSHDTYTDNSSSSDESTAERGRTRDIMAKQSGLSSATYARTKKIINEGSEELKNKVRQGKTSIAYAYKSLVRRDDHQAENIPPLPENRYDIIVADPPWAYDINTRGSPDEHYAVMSQEEIKELQVPSADNSILFLWATFPKLPEALTVMKAWGYKYKTGAVWVKDKIGTGYYFRGQAELLLVGEKGEMPVPEEANRVSSVIEAPRQEHSKKPEIVYRIVEQMYPNRTYLELFARNYRVGWTSWGNEV